jgi:hypothetical protein
MIKFMNTEKQMVSNAKLSDKSAIALLPKFKEKLPSLFEKNGPNNVVNLLINHLTDEEFKTRASEKEASSVKAEKEKAEKQAAKEKQNQLQLAYAQRGGRGHRGDRGGRGGGKGGFSNNGQRGSY